MWAFVHDTNTKKAYPHEFSGQVLFTYPTENVNVWTHLFDLGGSHMKYAIQPFPMGGKTYWVIFDDQNDTSSHLFASKEEAREALQKERGKPASEIHLQGRA